MVLLADSLKKSERRNRRCSFGKHADRTGTAVNPDKLFTCNLNRETLAPLGTTALDHKTTVLAGHANQKTVGTLARCIAGLKCSFHDELQYQISMLLLSSP